MLVCTDTVITGARIVQEIGRITAASGWHGVNCERAAYRDQALKALIAKAKDFEADAVIDLDYSIDGANDLDLTSIPVERIAVSGIAVKLSRAA